MDTWYYRPGHRWRYDSDVVPLGMEMRFRETASPTEGACPCSCGRCAPDGKHHSDDGCVCRVLGCFCLEPSAA